MSKVKYCKLALIFLPIIILSALSIAMIILRKIPQVSQMPIYDASAFYGSRLYKIPNNVRNFSFGSIRELFLNFLEKLLRRFKVIVLRAENKINDWIVRLRKKRENGRNSESNIFVKEAVWNGADRDFVKNLGSALNLTDNKSKEFTEQENAILQRIKKDPKDANAYKDLGFLYFEHKNYKDAGSSFEEALRLGDRDERILKILDEIQ